MITFSVVKSLRVKILLGVLVISVVSFSVVISHHLRSLDLVSSNQTKLYTSGIFPLLNSSISPLLAARDYASIEDVTDSFVATQTLEFVRIRDRTGKVVVLSGFIPANFTALKKSFPLRNGIRFTTRKLMLASQWVGDVDYGYTMAPIIGAQNSALQNGIAIAAFAILLTMGVLIAVVTFLTRSLKTLANGAKKVSDGDLSVSIAIEGEDEVADTARAFNKMVVSLQDARTRQKESLAELQQQKEILSTTQHIARMGYWRLNVESKKISLSEECREIFGFESSLQECELGKMLSIVHPDDVAMVRTQLSKESYSISNELNYRIIILKGVERAIYSKTELLRDTQGSPQTLLGIAQDVTERYKIEQAHRESEARLRAAQKIANIGNLEWSIKDGSGLWADEVYRVFGVSSGDYPPSFSSFIKLVHVDDRDYVNEKMASSYASHEAVDFEYRVSADNGDIRWVNAILKVEMYTEDGSARMVGIVQNISARKISEEHAKLLQKQLQQSQKMEAIGQLTGGIAHDFNNILAVIMGYSGLALDRCGDKESVQFKEFLQEIYYAGERATELISQMMTFSRTSINEPQYISIIPLVKDVSKMLGSILPSSIQIKTHFETNISNILIDPIQLQQVIMNLCINARDAMKGKGKLQITIQSTTFFAHNLSADPDTSGVFSRIISCESCHEVIADGDYVELAIADNGYGIKSSELSQIFEPFFTTKDVGKGTGMGLSMVHGIVHEHHGHILIKSVEGGGTIFKILFPSATEDNSEGQSQTTELEPLRPNLNLANILIVDDEASVARYIATLFEQYGSQVSVFTDSKQALRSFQDNFKNYDLLVIDQTMPELTGAEFSKIVLAQTATFPIILCTGYSDSLNEDQAIKLGIRKYLYKPVKPEILLNVANELLT